jgi:membrane-associated phospholipid phosphatase
LNPRPPLLPFAAGALLCAGSFLLDAPVVTWVAAHSDPLVLRVARFFTRWGDFPPVALLLLFLLMIAWLLGRRFLSRILLLMLSSAVAGGLAANLLRILTGRARPSTKGPPGWYGLRNHGRWIAGSYKFSSFPSAHTAVAIACVVPLWLLLPARLRLSVAFTATASRILLNAHHLSDVLCSVWLGAAISSLLCAHFGPRVSADPKITDIPWKKT